MVSIFVSMTCTHEWLYNVQIEGTTNKAGRGPSVWDEFVKTFPGSFLNSLSLWPCSNQLYIIYHAHFPYFHDFPFCLERIADHSTMSTTIDSYKRYKVNRELTRATFIFPSSILLFWGHY